MKNYISLFKQAIINDYINLYILSVTIILYLLDYLIWKLYLANRDIYIQTLGGIYPIRFLVIVFVINTFLAIFSYEREKEMSYLLFSATAFIGILVLILEMFYFISLAGYA